MAIKGHLMHIGIILCTNYTVATCTHKPSQNNSHIYFLFIYCFLFLSIFTYYYYCSSKFMNNNKNSISIFYISLLLSTSQQNNKNIAENCDEVRSYNSTYAKRFMDFIIIYIYQCRISDSWGFEAYNPIHEITVYQMHYHSEQSDTDICAQSNFVLRTSKEPKKKRLWSYLFSHG